MSPLALRITVQMFGCSLRYLWLEYKQIIVEVKNTSNTRHLHSFKS